KVIPAASALTVCAALMGDALFSQDDIYNELKDDFDRLQDSFIQELRRYYPFFPMLPAISLRDVEVDGYTIPEDSWVVLDIYGTNHDSRHIENPETFKVDRYVENAKDISYEEEYEMIAQGGGDFRSMHRCAGEWITLHTLRVLSDHLVNKFEFTIPEQIIEITLDHFTTYQQDFLLMIKDYI